MAGTLEVTEELCWMPAGWIFDTVLERMATELHKNQATELAEQLLAARTEANGGYLDLRNMDEETCNRLMKAADTAYGRIQREGLPGLNTSAFCEGLLEQFQQFRDMLDMVQQKCLKQK